MVDRALDAAEKRGRRSKPLGGDDHDEMLIVGRCLLGSRRRLISGLREIAAAARPWNLSWITRGIKFRGESDYKIDDEEKEEEEDEHGSHFSTPIGGRDGVSEGATGSEEPGTARSRLFTAATGRDVTSSVAESD
ncbi:uncharacterized protein [Physcomitrium patens]|uniref:uncharacterized protein n=1 Tax=Physcomitrium patens TaxID=3218 RepID=UPI00024AC2F6